MGKVLSAVVLSVLICIGVVCGQERGTIRLVQNSTQNSSAGIVEVYINDKWGGICNTSSFGQNEADVICHQLGYNKAQNYSTAAKMKSFGSIREISITNVDCTNDYYQVILQCDVIYTGTCNAGMAVTVNCGMTRVWDDPYSGQIRLQDGTYTSGGLVEIYCNDDFGTICGDNFNDNAADTVCIQLGYTSAADYNEIQSSNMRTWLGNVACSNTYSCLSSCSSCPSASYSCQVGFGFRVAVNCTYADGSSNKGSTISQCDINALIRQIGRLIGIIIGSVIGFFALLFLIICIPLCICCCCGIGVGAFAVSKA